MNNLLAQQVENHAAHGAGIQSAAAVMQSGEPAPRLTSRQSEVLSLLCEGLPDKLIARRLDLSHHTVRGHVQILYGLLRVSNRMQAMFAARQRGLIN
jgi:DNA-binding NarL/FixJ family response regulator